MKKHIKQNQKKKSAYILKKYILRTENQNQNMSIQEKQMGPQILSNQQLDERKIIKQFQFKRKMLMKALKMKQKQKYMKASEVPSFQNKEGVRQQLKNHSNRQNMSTQVVNENTKTSSLQYETKSLRSYILTSGSKEQQKLKLSIDVQTQTKNYIKQKKIMKDEKPQKIKQKKMPLVKEVEMKVRKQRKEYKEPKEQRGQKKNQQGQLISKAPKNKKHQKTEEQIQRIKNQLTTILIKNQAQKGNIVESNSLSFYSFYQSSGQMVNPQYETHFSSLMQSMNKKIQKFYENRLLKQIILDQFYRKYNKRKIRKVKRSCKQAKNEQEVVNSKLSQTHRQISEKGREQSKSKNKQNGIEEDQKQISTRIFNSSRRSRRLINDRFKIAIFDKAKQRQINLPSYQLQQSLEMGPFDQENQQDTQPFNPSQAWSQQFNQISSLLLIKYPFLKCKMKCHQSKNDQPIIHSPRVEETNKIQQYCHKKRNIEIKRTRRIKRNCNPKQNVEEQLKRQPKVLKQNKNRNKKGGFQGLKQLRFEIHEQEELGKSFDCNLNVYHDDEDNQDISQYLLLNDSHQNSMQKGGKFQCSILNQNKSSNKLKSKNQNLSFQFESQNSVLNTKFEDRVIVNEALPGYKNLSNKNQEWSLFKGQRGQEYFYMSQEMD